MSAGVICARCGREITGKYPIKVVFFFAKSDEEFTEERLPKELQKVIKNNYCRQCATRIGSFVARPETPIPDIPALKPGYKKAHVARSGKKPRIPEEENAKVYERYEAGESFTEIGDSYGMSNE